MGTIDPAPPVVVCDAGPLIHLDEVGPMDLLADLAEILVPNEKIYPINLINVNPRG